MSGTESGHELWDLRTLARARRLCDWMFSEIRPAGARRAAEVGAGIGTFSERLLAAGVEDLLLVEPEPACAAELERLFADDGRVRVARESLPASPSLRARRRELDLVVCQNVLEHIEDDRSALAAMAAALRPGGRIFLLVPAHQRLFGSLDRAYGHFRRYGRSRLLDLAASADLDVDRLYSFNLPGILGWWVSGKRGSPRIAEGPLRAYDAAIRFWRPVEQRVRPPVGLSLILDATMPAR
jgi:SAM-dependent methyltransferase